LNDSDQADKAGFFKSFSAICTKRSSGEYCLITVQRHGGELDTGGSCDPSSGTCSNKCKSKVQGIKDDFGCCINMVFELIDADAKTDSPSGTELAEWVSDTCHVSIPDPCIPNRKIVLFVTIANLRYDFVKDNEELVYDLLTLDIALAAGVSDKQVTIVDYKKIGSLVQFEVDIQVDSDGFVDATADDLENPDTFSFVNLGSGLSDDSKRDPTSPFYVSSAKTKTVSNGAATLLVSFSFMFIALLALLF